MTLRMKKTNIYETPLRRRDYDFFRVMCSWGLTVFIKKRSETDLKFNRLEKDKERRAGIVLHVVVHGERQPVGHHFLHDRLRSSQHELRMFGI